MDALKIGSFLKELRKQKGLTQAEVADYLYVSPKTISRWENGDGIPDINILTDIADFYGITVDELLRGERKKIEDNKNTEIKPDYERKLNSLNKYLFVSLGILGFLIILGVILGFVINEEIALVLSILGIIISSIVYIYGYKDINDKLKKENNYLSDTKPIIIKKSLFFLDMIISSLVLLSIILASFLLAIYISFIYLIIRSYLKRTIKRVDKLKSCLELIIYSSSIIVILTILQINYEFAPALGGGMLVKVVETTPLIVYLIDTINIGILWYKLSAIIFQILSVVGLGILFVPKLKGKKIIYILSMLLGIISFILPIIELNRYDHSQIFNYHWFLSSSGTIVLVVLIITIISYIVCLKKLKKINYYHGKRNVMAQRLY